MAVRAWIFAVVVASAGCATGGVSAPRPFPGAGTPSASAPLEAEGGEIVRTALHFRGVPYRTGGSDPAGFDCSGFVQYVFAQHQVPLPREVREQVRIGRSVRPDEARPGDLVFFAIGGGRPSHVGVVVGGDEFVHAPSSRGVVRVERLSAPYWQSRLTSVRRVR